MKTTLLILFLFIAIHFPPSTLMAGEIDSATLPEETTSFTLEDIGNRMKSGEPGFSSPPTEPSALPSAGTGKSINDIMEIAPARDNINGAAPADVISGGEFWGLKEGAWGSQTGSLIPTPIPKTGQTTFYATGDDGDLETGRAWPNPRFTNNGNGTVTDNLTGLVWLKNADCFGERNWASAMSDCSTIANGVCGLTDGSRAGDWHLPNVVELQSIVHYEYYSPSVPDTAGTGQWSAGNPFDNVQSSAYWASTSIVSVLSAAWSVSMYNGDVYAYYKTQIHYMWPVRGGQ